MLGLLSISVSAQSVFPWQVALEEVSVPGFSGLHSFVYAQADGKWLLLGGRKDGLHARQPFNAFPAAQNNTQLFVIDPTTSQLWSAPLTGLPAAIQEQWQSTNMNFHQIADTLYIAGGYAYSVTAGDHITFPRLSTVIVSQTISAIIQGQSVQPYLQTLTDERFAVTGGQLAALGSTFYLVGGHRFDGRYNPMGGPTYTQTYSNQIRTFHVQNSPGNLSCSFNPPLTDAVHLHRRDYNLLPMIYPGDSAGFMISAGVFQPSADLPYLYPVEIRPQGITARADFNQYLSQYHSAHASLFFQGEMHHLFFGGMSQFRYINGQLTEDQQVPFVQTISRLSRLANGALEEFSLPLEMPGLRGAGAEFIPNHTLPFDSLEILHLDEIPGDSILLGHIVGGLFSPLANPFSSNQTTQTSASGSIYAVWLIQDKNTTDILLPGKQERHFRIWPNPVRDRLMLDISSGDGTDCYWYVTHADGRMVTGGYFTLRADGSQREVLRVGNDLSSGMYQLTVLIDGRFGQSLHWIKE